MTLYNIVVTIVYTLYTHSGSEGLFSRASTRSVKFSTSEINLSSFLANPLLISQFSDQTLFAVLVSRV